MVDRIQGRGASIDVHVGPGSTVIVINKDTKGRDTSLDAPVEHASILDPTLFRAALQDFIQFGADDIDKGRAYEQLLTKLRLAKHIFTFRELQEDLNAQLKETNNVREGSTLGSMPADFKGFRALLEEDATEIWTNPK